MVRFYLIIRGLWGLFQQHLPSSSGAVPCNESPNDQPSVPPPPGVLPSTETLNNHPLVPLRSGAPPSTEAPPDQ
ncbi:hypothetical protein ACFX1W_041233 [Malus domestica]